MVSNGANRIGYREWTLFTKSQWVLPCIRHQENRCCQRSQVQDVKRQQCFFGSSQRRLWFHFLRQVLGGFLFLLANKGWYLFSFARATLAHIFRWLGGFHRCRTGERRRYKNGEGGKVRERKREGESVLAKAPPLSIPLAWACSLDATRECHAISRAVI